VLEFKSHRPLPLASASRPSEGLAARTGWRASIALAVLVVVVGGVARGQSVPLVTSTENQDGKVFDIATQMDAILSPQNKRMRLAQGRVRAAFRLSDRERMFGEDQSFPYAAAPNARELVVRLSLAGDGAQAPRGQEP
jgi:hypothetical protein